MPKYWDYSISPAEIRCLGGYIADFDTKIDGIVKKILEIRWAYLFPSLKPPSVWGSAIQSVTIVRMKELASARKPPLVINPPPSSLCSSRKIKTSSRCSESDGLTAGLKSNTLLNTTTKHYQSFFLWLPPCGRSFLPLLFWRTQKIVVILVRIGSISDLSNQYLNFGWVTKTVRKTGVKRGQVVSWLICLPPA